MAPKWWLLLVIAMSAFFQCQGEAMAQGTRKPNIIFILADDLGYGDLGCYGQKKIKTPNIDKLAKQGMRFTQFYAGSTVCAPSRCTLMTGLHTGHCLVRGNARVPLRPTDVTVANILKGLGYVTGLIGKWGLGEAGSTGVPTKQGFDYFFGYLNQHHAHNYYPDFLWRNEEKVPLPNVVPKDNVATKRQVYSHDLFMKEAKEFIRKNKNRPFFLYLALTIPHANNERGRALGNGMEVPSDAPYSKENWPQPQKDHAAMITYMDKDLGELMDLLTELNLDDNTIIFFTSDNGPHQEGGANPNFFNSSGGLRGFKRSLHEGGIRVPLIVRWTGKIRPGSETNHMAAFWDFLPTAVDLAGGKIPQGIDGQSFLPTLLGKKQDQPKALYWEFHERGFAQGARMGKWKAVRKNQKNIQLYDLEKDLHEDNDIAARHPEVVARFEAYFESERIPSPQWKIKGEK